MRLSPLHSAGLCLLLVPMAADAQDGRSISVLIPRIGLRVNLPVDLPVDLPIDLPTGGTTRRPRGGSVDLPSGPSAPASATARSVIRTGERYIGIPYRWGGDTPREGFDCSGFTRHVFARHGIAIPRTSRQQATVGYRLPRSWRSLRPGDLVMFANRGGRINHVAIYAGNNRIIHSTSSGGGVRYDDLRTRRGRWFAEHMVAARRVVSNGHSLVRALTALDLRFDGSDAPDWAPRITIY
ncbi:MAG: C40 family peptidase [Gemmatimonadaceae bacterium]